jgi:hypothetical protein
MKIRFSDASPTTTEDEEHVPEAARAAIQQLCDSVLAHVDRSRPALCNSANCSCPSLTDPSARIATTQHRIEVATLVFNQSLDLAIAPDPPPQARTVIEVHVVWPPSATDHSAMLFTQVNVTLYADGDAEESLAAKPIVRECIGLLCSTRTTTPILPGTRAALKQSSRLSGNEDDHLLELVLDERVDPPLVISDTAFDNNVTQLILHANDAKLLSPINLNLTTVAACASTDVATDLSPVLDAIRESLVECATIMSTLKCEQLVKQRVRLALNVQAAPAGPVVVGRIDTRVSSDGIVVDITISGLRSLRLPDVRHAGTDTAVVWPANVDKYEFPGMNGLRMALSRLRIPNVLTDTRIRFKCNNDSCVVDPIRSALTSKGSFGGWNVPMRFGFSSVFLRWGVFDWDIAFPFVDDKKLFDNKLVSSGGSAQVTLEVELPGILDTNNTSTNGSTKNNAAATFVLFASNLGQNWSSSLAPPPMQQHAIGPYVDMAKPLVGIDQVFKRLTRAGAARDSVLMGQPISKLSNGQQRLADGLAVLLAPKCIAQSDTIASFKMCAPPSSAIINVTIDENHIVVPLKKRDWAAPTDESIPPQASMLEDEWRNSEAGSFAELSAYDGAADGCVDIHIRALVPGSVCHFNFQFLNVSAEGEISTAQVPWLARTEYNFWSNEDIKALMNMVQRPEDGGCTEVVDINIGRANIPGCREGIELFCHPEYAAEVISFVFQGSEFHTNVPLAIVGTNNGANATSIGMIGMNTTNGTCSANISWLIKWSTIIVPHTPGRSHDLIVGSTANQSDIIRAGHNTLTLCFRFVQQQPLMRTTAIETCIPLKLDEGQPINQSLSKAVARSDLLPPGVLAVTTVENGTAKYTALIVRHYQRGASMLVPDGWRIMDSTVPGWTERDMTTFEGAEVLQSNASLTQVIDTTAGVLHPVRAVSIPSGTLVMESVGDVSCRINGSVTVKQTSSFMPEGTTGGFAKTSDLTERVIFTDPNIVGLAYHDEQHPVLEIEAASGELTVQNSTPTFADTLHSLKSLDNINCEMAQQCDGFIKGVLTNPSTTARLPLLRDISIGQIIDGALSFNSLRHTLCSAVVPIDQLCGTIKRKMPPSVDVVCNVFIDEHELMFNLSLQVSDKPHLPFGLDLAHIPFEEPMNITLFSTHDIPTTLELLFETTAVIDLHSSSRRMQMKTIMLSANLTAGGSDNIPVEAGALVFNLGDVKANLTAHLLFKTVNSSAFDDAGIITGDSSGDVIEVSAKGTLSATFVLPSLPDCNQDIKQTVHNSKVHSTVIQCPNFETSLKNDVFSKTSLHYFKNSAGKVAAAFRSGIDNFVEHGLGAGVTNGVIPLIGRAANDAIINDLRDVFDGKFESKIMHMLIANTTKIMARDPTVSKGPAVLRGMIQGGLDAFTDILCILLHSQLVTCPAIPKVAKSPDDGESYAWHIVMAKNFTLDHGTLQCDIGDHGTVSHDQGVKVYIGYKVQFVLTYNSHDGLKTVWSKHPMLAGTKRFDAHIRADIVKSASASRGKFGFLDMSATAEGQLEGRIEAHTKEADDSCCSSTFEVSASLNLEADLGVHNAFDFKADLYFGFEWSKGDSHTTPKATHFTNVLFCLDGVLKAVANYVKKTDRMVDRIAKNLKPLVESEVIVYIFDKLHHGNAHNVLGMCEERLPHMKPEFEMAKKVIHFLLHDLKDWADRANGLLKNIGANGCGAAKKVFDFKIDFTDDKPTATPLHGVEREQDQCDARSLIIAHEGKRRCMYYDSSKAKHPTVGIGYNLDNAHAKQDIEAVGADYEQIRSGKKCLTSDKQVMELFEPAYLRAAAEAMKVVSSFSTLCCNVQEVMVDMTYNLGSLSSWHTFVPLINSHQWAAAATDGKQQPWCKEVRRRCTDDKGPNGDMDRVQIGCPTPAPVPPTPTPAPSPSRSCHSDGWCFDDGVDPYTQKSAKDSWKQLNPSSQAGNEKFGLTCPMCKNPAQALIQTAIAQISKTMADDVSEVEDDSKVLEMILPTFGLSTIFTWTKTLWVWPHVELYVGFPVGFSFNGAQLSLTTSGVVEMLKTGNINGLLNGLQIRTTDAKGHQLSVVTIAVGIEAGVSVGIFIFDGAARVGLTLTANLLYPVLNSEGFMTLPQLVALLKKNGFDPLAAFDETFRLDGYFEIRIDAHLCIYWGFGHHCWNWNISSSTDGRRKLATGPGAPSALSPSSMAMATSICLLFMPQRIPWSLFDFPWRLALLLALPSRSAPR